MKRVMEKKERKEIYDDEVRVFIYWAKYIGLEERWEIVDLTE